MEITVAPVEVLPKKEKYEYIIKQIDSLLLGENDLIANLANISSVLKYSFDHISWVGFYLLKKGELVLGPFQGKPACIRIALGRGVCGTSASKGETVLVPDVSQFPGHIYCDPDSRSEIVVPVYKQNALLGVLDVDSNQINAFDDVDKSYLERITKLISTS